MTKIRGIVVGILLALWCFPAVSSAKALPNESAPPPAVVSHGIAASGTTTVSATDSESANFSNREQQTPALQDFKGGDAVIYIGGGTVLIVVIILLILLV
jgi:hypothetical protein